jgi:predicted enzyme related to lactoylglutathione lyase
MLGGDGQPAAEIHDAAMPTGIPPVWLLHLPVGDLAESLLRVEEEGGKVLHSRGDPPSSAVIQDPVDVSLILQST